MKYLIVNTFIVLSLLLSGCATNMVADRVSKPSEAKLGSELEISYNQQHLNICDDGFRNFNFQFVKNVPKNKDNTAIPLSLSNKNTTYFCQSQENDTHIEPCIDDNKLNCYEVIDKRMSRFKTLNIYLDNPDTPYQMTDDIYHVNEKLRGLYIVTVPLDIVTLPVQAVGVVLIGTYWLVYFIAIAI